MYIFLSLSLSFCNFDLKVVTIHPFWLRICLHPTFNYPGLDFDGLEAQKWPTMFFFSKVKKLTSQNLSMLSKNKNVLLWRKSYVKVNTKINQLNREIRRIQADKNLVESEKIDKVKQLNIIKNDMIQNLTEAVLSWEKSTGERVKRPLWWNK